MHRAERHDDVEHLVAMLSFLMSLMEMKLVEDEA